MPMRGRGGNGHVAQNMRIKITKSKKIKNKKSKGAILLRAPRRAATHNKSTTTTTVKKVTAKKVYEFFVQARERCKKYCKKQTKTKQQTKADTTKGPPRPSAFPPAWTTPSHI